MIGILEAIWLFLMSQLIAGFLYYQHDYDNIGFKLFFKHKSSAPLLLLQIGMVVFIVLLYLYYKHMVAFHVTVDSYPILFADKDPGRLKGLSEIQSLIVVNVIPWVGFIWMWYAFFKSDQSVWNRVSNKEVGMFEIVSSPLSFFGGWNDYRYGRSPAKSASFVPYWQPVLIMWPLTLAAGVLTATNITRFFQ